MAKSTIRSKEIKEALLDADKMVNAIQENTKSTVDSLLAEKSVTNYVKS